MSTPPILPQPPVHVLWTSGWDSTFRIAQLLRDDSAGRVSVQPWYVCDPERPSTTIELETMETLRGAFGADSRFAFERLAPLQVVDRRSIAPDPEITAQFRCLLREQYLGSQYEWLARLAAQEGIRFEIGLKADDRPVQRLGDRIVPDGSPSRFAIDPGLSAEDLGDLALFRWFTFPIVDVTKTQMRAIAERDGFDTIMRQTWFCHTPLAGRRPCGYCAPCRHAREEGFGDRVPRPTPLRHLEHRATRLSRRLRRTTG